jgi:rhodanese-related sulfurtransferase
MRLSSLWRAPRRASFGGVPEVSPQEFKRWLDENRLLQIVDARTGLEYHQGTIKGALHAPVTGMPDSLTRLSLDRSIPVVVLCLSGHRSLPEARWLRDNGYEAYSLHGGLLAWKHAGYSLSSASTTPPRSTDRATG